MMKIKKRSIEPVYSKSMKDMIGELDSDGNKRLVKICELAESLNTNDLVAKMITTVASDQSVFDKFMKNNHRSTLNEISIHLSRCEDLLEMDQDILYEFLNLNPNSKAVLFRVMNEIGKSGIEFSKVDLKETLDQARILSITGECSDDEKMSDDDKEEYEESAGYKYAFKS